MAPRQKRGLLGRLRELRSNDSGAIALIMAAALVGLMGMGALGIDVGYMYSVRDNRKKTADAGALAGAIAGSNWYNAASSILTVNGQSLSDADIQQGYWSYNQRQFFLTAPSETPAPVPAIQVKVSKQIQLSFASLLPGVNSHPTLSGTSVAVEPATSSSGTGGGWGILEIGNGNVKITGAVASNGSVGVNGNGDVTVTGSGSISGNLMVNGNGDVKLTGAAKVDSSLWQNGNGKFTMTGSAAVKGKAYIDDAVSQSYTWSTSINGNTYQNGSGFQEGDISSDASGATVAQTASQDAQTAYANFSSLTKTTGPDKISSGHTSVSISGGSGENVVELSSLKLSGDSTLTLSAPSDGSFVIKVSGNFSVSGAAKIVLAGGLEAANVTYVNTGTSTVKVTGSGSIKGNILSPNGAIKLSGAAEYYGALISGKNIILSGSAHSPEKISWLTSPSGSTTVRGAHLVE
jgi:Flp pilus assembly protein TadG